MANVIKPKRSSVAGNVPTTAQIGQYEIAMNTADKKIFTSDGSSIIQLAAGYLSGLGDIQISSVADKQGLIYDSTSGKWINSIIGDVVGPVNATDNALVRFDSTTGKLIQNSAITVSDTGAMSGVESISALNFAQFNTSNASVVEALGALSWDQVNRTLNISMGNGVNQSVGQELPVPVQSSTNNGLVNGKVVYIVGSNGDNQLVEYAQANAETTSSKAFGLMTETVSGGAKGLCTTFGYVHDLDTSALTEGAAVWLSPTVAGGMTTTKPTAPNHLVLIGWCTRSHATQGVIFVKIQNGYELDELHDVLITNKQNGQALVYDASVGVWKNVNIALAGDVSGSTSFDGSTLTINTSITPTEAILATYRYTATAGQTSFSGLDLDSKPLAYLPNGLFVTLNGVVLQNVTDYTATDGLTIVLNSATSAGDEIDIYSFANLSAANVHALVDTLYVRLDGSYSNPVWITSLDYSKLTGSVPTWNQNTTGNAATATYATSAGNADTVDGYHASAFLRDIGTSLSSSGYTKLSNGLIIQWATVGRGTNNFPIAFPNACVSLGFSVASGDGGAFATVELQMNVSTTQITLVYNRIVTYRYIAIGY